MALNIIKKNNPTQDILDSNKILLSHINNYSPSLFLTLSGFNNNFFNFYKNKVIDECNIFSPHSPITDNLLDIISKFIPISSEFFPKTSLSFNSTLLSSSSKFTYYRNNKDIYSLLHDSLAKCAISSIKNNSSPASLSISIEPDVIQSQLEILANLIASLKIQLLEKKPKTKFVEKIIEKTEKELKLILSSDNLNIDRLIGLSEFIPALSKFTLFLDDNTVDISTNHFTKGFDFFKTAHRYSCGWTLENINLKDINKYLNFMPVSVDFDSWNIFTENRALLSSFFKFKLKSIDDSIKRYKLTPDLLFPINYTDSITNKSIDTSLSSVKLIDNLYSLKKQLETSRDFFLTDIRKGLVDFSSSNSYLKNINSLFFQINKEFSSIDDSISSFLHPDSSFLPMNFFDTKKFLLDSLSNPHLSFKSLDKYSSKIVRSFLSTRKLPSIDAIDSSVSKFIEIKNLYISNNSITLPFYSKKISSADLSNESFLSDNFSEVFNKQSNRFNSFKSILDCSDSDISYFFTISSNDSTFRFNIPLNAFEEFFSNKDNLKFFSFTSDEKPRIIIDFDGFYNSFEQYSIIDKDDIDNSSISL
jgi:hypothetical protein